MKPVLTFLIFCTLLVACNKEPEGNGHLCPRIPCPESFSCKVNGVPWTPKGQGHSCQAITTYYYPEGGENIRFGHFSIRAQNCQPDRTVAIVFSFDSITQAQVLNLKTTALTAAYVEFPQQIESFDSIIDGEVDLQHIQANSYDAPDSPWGRAKGTFWMTLMNEAGDTVTITDGKFDVAVP